VTGREDQATGSQAPSGNGSPGRRAARRGAVVTGATLVASFAILLAESALGLI
jgi:hypothetical protein